jgi:hypothetical protein
MMSHTNHGKAIIAIILAVLLVCHATAWAASPGPILDPLPLPSWEPPSQDPNRDRHWDWTEDVLYRLYIAGSDDVTTALPYFNPEGPAFHDLNAGGAALDIYPADGWVLVARDFGTEGREVVVPYFIVYNKYRGILRLFFYNTIIHEAFTSGLVKLEQPHASQAAALFTFGESRYFVTDFDAGLTQEAVVPLGHLQWCYADFVILGYDPQPPTDATLAFWFTGVEVSELEVSGEVNLTQVTNKAHITGRQDLQGAFVTAHKKYKSVGTALADLEKAVGAGKNGFLKKYLGPIFDSPFADAVPYLSAAAGFVQALLGGKPTQVIPMKFQGGVELSGTLTTVNFLHTLSVRVPGAPLSDPNDNARPLYTEPLGIFNVVDQPLMRRQVDITCKQDRRTWEWICSEEADYAFQNAPHVAINPALHDAAVEVRAGLIFANQAVTYHSLPTFRWLTLHESLDEGEQSTYAQLNMALEVTVMPDNGGYDAPIVMTNTYGIAQQVISD